MYITAICLHSILILNFKKHGYYCLKDTIRIQQSHTTISKESHYSEKTLGGIGGIRRFFLRQSPNL
jgi:hypothetical protein